jgi:hypothetical protein
MSGKTSRVGLPTDDREIEIKKPTPPTVVHREETEKGDIAKSFQQLVATQFVSKRFKDLMGSSRFSRSEVMTLSLLEINRIVSKILSIDEADVSPSALNNVSFEEKRELLELYELKKRFKKNSFAFSYAVHDAFMGMFGLGMQSFEGGSRMEGTQMVGGTFQKILNPDDMGILEKAKRRIMGNVLYTDDKE